MVSFFVPGVPVPKGSARSFYNKKAGKSITVQDNAERQKPWSSLISFTATQEGCTPKEGPISLTLHFCMPRPKSHFRTGKHTSHILKPDAPRHHISTPDLDKLIRCVKDALTNIAWKDDKQVCVTNRCAKQYGDLPGVYITIEELRD